MTLRLRRNGILVVALLGLGPLALACGGSDTSGPDPSEPSEQEKALALGLVADQEVVLIFNALALADELALVGDALGQGDLDGARAQLKLVRVEVIEGRSVSTGEEKVLFTAADLIVVAIERALRIPRES